MTCAKLYRVIAHDGVIEIHVPHFRHENWWSDPTPRARLHATDLSDDVEETERRMDRREGELHHAGSRDAGGFRDRRSGAGI